jgi:hypothetical protein
MTPPISLPPRSPLLVVALVIAVALCLVSCALLLAIPTSSINVDTVYGGM